MQNTEQRGPLPGTQRGLTEEGETVAQAVRTQLTAAGTILANKYIYIS